MLIELQQVIPTPLPEKIIKASEIWDQDLVIKPNSKILISAQSGMGKSTLLHLIYGLRKDYQGKLLIKGKCARGLNYESWETLRRNSISLVFQDLRLFPHLTARENLRLIPDPNPASLPLMKWRNDWACFHTLSNRFPLSPTDKGSELPSFGPFESLFNY